MDHRPEQVGTLGLIVVVRHGEFGAEEKIADRVLVEHAMDEDALGMTLKIDAVITAAVSVKGSSVPFDPGKILTVEGFKVGREDLELGKKIELEILGKGTHLGGADGVEDDLEHGGESRENVEVRKTGKSRAMNRLRIQETALIGTVQFIPFISVKKPRNPPLTFWDRCGRSRR